MQWIFDNFQVFILIALGVGSVLKSLLEAKTRQKQQTEEEYDPGEVFAPDEDYEQAVPSGPPPIHRQSTPPPLRDSGYHEAVAEETAKALKHQQDLAERLRVIRETRATTTGGAQATRARISARGATAAPTEVPQGLRARLRNPAEVRRAVAMREILGPPISLR